MDLERVDNLKLFSDKKNNFSRNSRAENTKRAMTKSTFYLHLGKLIHSSRCFSTAASSTDFFISSTSGIFGSQKIEISSHTEPKNVLPCQIGIQNLLTPYRFEC
jgi:hypothetical protein